jgi:hypothetical protein
MKLLYNIPFVASCKVPRVIPSTNINNIFFHLGENIYANFAKSYLNMCEALLDNDL